jgi:hypothetical protein
VVGFAYARLVDDLARHHTVRAQVNQLVHSCKPTLQQNNKQLINN